jgi:glycosyltransferase involved in cell wall biosynthesis
LLALSARLSRGTSAIIYNSETAARQHEAIGFDRTRSIYIPNGFDSRLYRPDPDGRVRLRALFGIGDAALVIAMVARFHPMKDHAMLAGAIAKARAAGHDLHLLLVGTGMDAPPPELARAIAAAVPADRLTLVGERHDVADWLPGVDILALSSAWGEAFPNILGEAMMCGLSCVATDVGDSAAILGESGIVTPARDASAMAQALADLSREGADGRARRGAAARARAVDRYELDHVARLYHRLYTETLKTASPQRGRARPVDAASGVRPA